MRISKQQRLVSPSHARSKKQESEGAERLRGRKTKGSGNGDEKGDVRVHKIVRLEQKTTKRKSFSVTREMVEKIETAALAAGEVPAIEVEFCDERGKKQEAVAVVPLWVLEAIAAKAWHED